MKIRNDFVTNSSSNSFVIAYKTPPNIDQQTLKKYPYFSKYNDLIEQLLFSHGRWGENETFVIADTNDIDDAFENFFNWNDEESISEILSQNEWVEEIYDECKRKVSEGFQIILKTIDYRDNALIEFIESLAVSNSDFLLLLNEND
jgi:hypothetical protein